MSNDREAKGRNSLSPAANDGFFRYTGAPGLLSCLRAHSGGVIEPDDTDRPIGMCQHRGEFSGTAADIEKIKGALMLTIPKRDFLHECQIGWSERGSDAIVNGRMNGPICQTVEGPGPSFRYWLILYRSHSPFDRPLISKAFDELLTNTE